MTDQAKEFWNSKINTQKAFYSMEYFQEKANELRDEEIEYIWNQEFGDKLMEKPYRYRLIIQIYKVTKEIRIPTNWKLGILQARELSKQLAKDWTRHPSCESLVQHIDQYYDLYNEGSIKLIHKDFINL